MCVYSASHIPLYIYCSHCPSLLFSYSSPLLTFSSQIVTDEDGMPVQSTTTNTQLQVNEYALLSTTGIFFIQCVCLNLSLSDFAYLLLLYFFSRLLPSPLPLSYFLLLFLSLLPPSLPPSLSPLSPKRSPWEMILNQEANSN